MKEFQVKTPGRVCFFGDNADLIEKPAIAAAISAYLIVDFKVRKDDVIMLESVDLDFRESLEIGGEIKFDGPLKYIKAVIRNLSPHIDRGFSMTVRSEIPIGAGMSSSTALTIGAIRVIDRWKGLSMSPLEIAELSYLIESRDLGSECGRMDQYAISFGGITYITTDENASAEKLTHPDLKLIVADSKDTHDTAELQIWLRKRLHDKEPVLLESLNRVVAIVEEGKRAFHIQNLKLLGELMTRQQAEEKLMGTSTARLELMCRKSLDAGALGAKQMGAGGGGCIIALVENDKIARVEEALANLGCPVWNFDIVE